MFNFPHSSKRHVLFIIQCKTEEIGGKEIEFFKVTYLLNGSDLERIYKGLRKDLEILLQFLSLFGFSLTEIYKLYKRPFSYKSIYCP